MTEMFAASRRFSPPTSANDNVTKVVRGLIALGGWTQRDLATAAGIDETTVSNKMSGKRRWSLEDIDALSAAFGLEWSTFLQPPTLVISQVAQQLAGNDEAAPTGTVGAAGVRHVGLEPTTRCLVNMASDLRVINLAERRALRAASRPALDRTSSPTPPVMGVLLTVSGRFQTRPLTVTPSGRAS